MPATARSRDFRSRSSPSKKSKSSPARCARGLLPRTSARTEKPASTRQRATAEPTNPVAPVTRTFSLLPMPVRWSASQRGSNSPEDTRTSLPQQTLSSILQSLDQAVGTARGDDRRKFVASRREITDGSVEIDIDHPPAADQIVYVHGPPAGLQQPRFDDFAATTRFRTCLRIDDEPFP